MVAFGVCIFLGFVTVRREPIVCGWRIFWGHYDMRRLLLAGGFCGYHPVSTLACAFSRSLFFLWNG